MCLCVKLVEYSQLLGLVSLSFIPPAQLIIGDLMQRHTDKLTIMLQQLTETQFNLSKKKKKKSAILFTHRLNMLTTGLRMLAMI